MTSKRLPTRAMTTPGHPNVDPQEDHEEDEIWDDEVDEVDLFEERRAQRRRRNFTILGFLLTLIAGLAIGSLVTRQHYRALKTIVTINGELITQDDFMHRMEVAAGAQTLQQMANELLQDQYAHKLGVVVTPAEVNARYNQLRIKPDFSQYLANTHQSPEDVMNKIRLELIVNRIVGKDVPVTDGDVDRYYKDQTDRNNANARFYTPPRVTIAVITTRNKDRILQAKRELDKGADFTTVATTYSEDLTSKDHGGELQPIVRGRTAYSKIPGLEKLIFGMKVGEQVGPTSFGSLWSIIRCLKQEPEAITPKDQVDYECRVGAMMAKLPKTTAARIRSDYIKFQQQAAIHTFRPEYKMVFGGR